MAVDSQRWTSKASRRTVLWIAAILSVPFCLAGTVRGEGETDETAGNSSEAVVAIAELPEAIPARTMEVVVCDMNGAPLAGARIHSSIWSKSKAPFLPNCDYVCDESGKATVRLPKDIEILRLWATQDGHVTMFAQWWPEMEPETREIPLHFEARLPKGTRIGGKVTARDGTPIPGARVNVMLVQPRNLPLVSPTPIPSTWLSEGKDAVSTDREGRWSLNNVPEGDDVQIRTMLSHSDFISESQWGSLQTEQEVAMSAFRDETATLIMHRGLSLTGMVFDADGKPVKGAVVIHGDDPYMQQGLQEVRTDAEGRYRFPPLSPGVINVTVVAAGWAPALENHPLSTKNTNLDFHLTPGRTVRLKFVDGSGRAVPDVYVGIAGWRKIKSLYNHSHPNVLDTGIPYRSNAQGIFEWTWAPSDEVKYDFFKEGLPHLPDQGVFPEEETQVIRLVRQPGPVRRGKPQPAF